MENYNLLTSSRTLALVKYLFFINLFLASFYLTYHQAVQEPLFEGDAIKVEAYPSDTLQHIEFIQQLFDGEIYIAHPLWHICTYSISKLTTLTLEFSAAIVSSLTLLVWALLIYYTLRKTLYTTLKDLAPYRQEFLLLSSTISLFFIAPLVFPPYNHLIARGVGSPNLWHNVTLWTVKPFALLGVLLTFWAIQQQTTKLYILAITTILLSIFAKPSFIIMFLPALVLFFFYKKEFAKPNIKFLLTIITLSVLVLAFQYINTYDFNIKKKIIIDFLGVWSTQTSSISMSLLLVLLLPVLVYKFSPTAQKNDLLTFSWLQVLIGIMLFATFAEEGRQYLHGNFGWSYQIALSLLYIFSMAEFLSSYSLLSKLKRYILLFLFIVQTYIGLEYFYKILLGRNPLYISILF